MTYDAEYMKVWRARNVEKRRAYQRAWYEANKEQQRSKARVRQQAWRENNREVHREQVRLWAKANPEKRRQIAARYSRTEAARTRAVFRLMRRNGDPLREQACDYVDILRSDPCAYCGAPMKAIDHITALAMGGTNDWNNLTAACAACNHRKWATPLLQFMLRNERMEAHA